MKLSIFGPRGCGKTTYLTCLYAQGGKVGSFAISAKDEPTRNYLAERWHQLFTGTELAPTALGLIPLHLVFSANRQAYDIELQDFAGALVMQDRGQDEVKKKLKDALRKSFQESSGLMIFIEAGEPDFQSQFDRRVELDSLMEVLHEQNNRELITRPIAIVITKWDKIISSTGKSDQAKEVEDWAVRGRKMSDGWTRSRYSMAGKITIITTMVKKTTSEPMIVAAGVMLNFMRPPPRGPSHPRAQAPARGRFSARCTTSGSVR